MPPRLQLADEPVQHGEMLWTWDGSMQSSWVLGQFPVRMVIAGYPLPHGKRGLVVIAPLEPTQKVVAWLQETGDVNFVVAPNKLHHFWAAAMKAAFPGSLLVAPLGLCLKHKKLPVDVRVTPLAGPQDLPGSWPADVIDVHPIQGLSLLDELALLHKPSSTLILTDTAFNFDQQWLKDHQQQVSMSWGLKLYLSLAGGHRKCCFTKTFKMFINDPVALKATFDQLLASWEFDQVCMAHGQFISKGGKQALLEGSIAFVDDILKGKQVAAASPGMSALAGTAAAFCVAAAVISTAVGIGMAGIMKVKGQ